MKSDFARVSFSAASVVLLCCGFFGSRTVDRERADSIYKDAMADYAAGRVDKAIDGLSRVARANPGNASARFQLACLLQDVKKDYLGAICNYREFLSCDTTGEKTALAQSRIVQCERLLGPELVKKYDIEGNATLAEQNLALSEKVAALEKTKVDLEKRLERAMVRAEESASETERMRKMLMADPVEDQTRPVIKTEVALLDDNESDGKADRIKYSEDAKNLLLETEKEDAATPFKVVQKKEKPVETKPAVEEPPHEPRPPEYVVQEGDTLYKLAVRFYGRRSAWTHIREANKAVISTDGRIKTGQKLVLP